MEIRCLTQYKSNKDKFIYMPILKIKPKKTNPLDK